MEHLLGQVLNDSRPRALSEYFNQTRPRLMKQYELQDLYHMEEMNNLYLDLQKLKKQYPHLTQDQLLLKAMGMREQQSNQDAQETRFKQQPRGLRM